MNHTNLLRSLGVALGLLVIAWALPVRSADDAAPAKESQAAAMRPTAEASTPAHETELGAPEKATGPDEFNKKEVDLAVYTLIVFLVLLAILWKFAWGPIVVGLAKREQRIAENIAAAQRSNDEAKQLLVEYDKKLAAAADQIRVMMDKARQEAEEAKVQIVAEAKEAAKLEFDRSRRELQRATDQALKDLSERATNLAVELASKIVRAQLKPQDHTRLVQEAMAEFAARSPSAN